MLGVDLMLVEIVYGDMFKILFGMGIYGFCSFVVCGLVVYCVIEKIIKKVIFIVVYMMEDSVENVEFLDGEFFVKGINKKVSFGEVVLKVYIFYNFLIEDIEFGFEEIVFYDLVNFMYLFGVYVCEVEVDLDIGKVDICLMVVMDDFGNVVNLLIVIG